MEAIGGAGGGLGGVPGALGARLGAFLQETPDDPVLLVGTLLLAWLPLCAVILASLAVVAKVQVALLRRRRSTAGIVLAPPGRLAPVTRRFVTNPRRTNGLVAVARVVLALGVVLGFTAVVLASGAPLLALPR